MIRRILVPKHPLGLQLFNISMSVRSHTECHLCGKGQRGEAQYRPYTAFAYSVPLEAKSDILNHLDLSINRRLVKVAYMRPFLNVPMVEWSG